MPWHMPPRICFPVLIEDQDNGAGVRHHIVMERFFFDLHERDRVLIDEEGTELPDATAACANALHEARQIMAAGIAEGALTLDCHIEVQDERRNVLLIVPFKDAVTFSSI